MPLNKFSVYFTTLFLTFFLLDVAQSSTKSKQNRILQLHPSPYLRSHADDPIDWQTISTKLLQTAKDNQQLILISSGYQSCYWCFRMKKDTFSDSKLARKINDLFIPILIDRELETIVDQQLQAFMQEQRGFGGWPITVILTPQGDPIVSFSYISAASLTDALDKLLNEWKTDAKSIIELAKTAHETRNKKHLQNDTLLTTPDYKKLLFNFLQQISSVSDNKLGGFGDKEKFPHIPQLNALLDIYLLNPDPALSHFLQLTLNKMLTGALRDQIGGGFFRYSSDRDWGNPHYEQMLHTQALMGKLLIRAGQSFNKSEYILAGKETLLNMVHQFRGNTSVNNKNNARGLYHAALSAVSDDQSSGGYYLWTSDELEKLLDEQWQSSVENMLMRDNQNASDPILPNLKGKQKVEVKKILLEKRNERSQHYDDKKLLAWHGLVLSGLSYGAQLSPELAKAAKSLAAQLMTQVAQQKLQTLMDVAAADAGAVSLSNLVYVAQGLIDWWQVSGDDKALQQAKTLLESAYHQFYKEDRWIQNNSYEFLAPSPTRAIADTQLPSSSATWLSLAWALSSLDTKEDKQVSQSSLKSKAEHVGSQLPQSLHNDAFFHATLLATVITRQWQLRSKLGNKPHSDPSQQQRKK